MPVLRLIRGASYGSCGERCMAVPLLVAVGDATADAMIAGLQAEIAKMNLGPGTAAGVDMGPLVTRQHFDKVCGYVAHGVAEGATLIVDGRNVTVQEGYRDGYYLGPCLFDHVKPGMKIYQKEIFGPVLGVVRVQSLQQAMDLIDAHEYGNGTCIFTRDGEAARYFSDHIQVGMVGINVPLPVPVAYHSFGGWKRSLFGDLGAGHRPVCGKTRCSISRRTNSRIVKLNSPAVPGCLPLQRAGCLLRQVWIAMPRGSHLPRFDYPPLRMVQFSGDTYTGGIEVHECDQVAVRVYSVAKTIAEVLI